MKREWQRERERRTERMRAREREIDIEEGVCSGIFDTNRQSEWGSTVKLVQPL